MRLSEDDWPYELHFFFSFGKGTGYCFWHHCWNNFTSWWSSRSVQIWFLLNVGARKDLSRNQIIPAYALDLKCPHGFPWIWFLSSCEPRKPNFEKNEMQIWQTNHPNHAKSSSTYRGVRHLITFANAWTRSEQRGTRISQKNWLSKTFCTTSQSEKESDARIEWNYMKWMYVIMGCVAGSVRSPFGPGPGPGLSETGHTLHFIMTTQHRFAESGLRKSAYIYKYMIYMWVISTPWVLGN